MGLFSDAVITRRQSVGSTPRKGQDCGKTAGCNKAWNGWPIRKSRTWINETFL